MQMSSIDAFQISTLTRFGYGILEFLQCWETLQELLLDCLTCDTALTDDGTDLFIPGSI